MEKDVDKPNASEGYVSFIWVLSYSKLLMTNMTVKPVTGLNAMLNKSHNRNQAQAFGFIKPNQKFKNVFWEVKEENLGT